MKIPRHHEVQVFQNGEIVVREGEETREMFIIREGRVEILKNVDGQHVRLAVLDRGSFFGEMSLLEGLPRSATARAVGPTTLLVLRPGSLLMQLRRDPTFAFELLQQMSRRIRELNDKLVVEVSRTAGPPSRSPEVSTARSEYAAAGEQVKVVAP